MDGVDGVAPPQLFASPFLRQHESAFGAFAGSASGYSPVTRTILQRFGDRLAHYLLHRAYRGLNGGMRSKLSDAGCDESVLTDDPHAMLFAFDEPLWSHLASRVAATEAHRAKSVRKLREVGEAGVNALSANHKYGFILPIVLTDRWMQDFTTGLRLTDPAATLPPSLHSTEQRVSLCAIVEDICLSLFELDNYLESPNHGMQELWAFLPVDWTVHTKGIQSTAHLACASKSTDVERHRMRVMEAEFAPHSAAQAELNRSSWYHDPAAVIEAARVAARGQLIDSPLIHSLRQSHVTPLRFWGVSSALPPWCQWVCEQAGLTHQLDRNRASPESTRYRGPTIGEVASASFLLTDAAGRSFELLLCGHRDAAGQILCFVIDRAGRSPSFRLCGSFEAAPAKGWSPDAVAEAITIDPRALIQAHYKPRAQEPQEQPAPAAVHSTIQSSSSCSNSTTAPRAQMKQQTAHELQCAFRSAMPLLKYSLYGPTLFAHNHPPQMRRLFTAHLIDSCMLESGLRPLPLVLSELISEFHSFDLPFRQDKATEQMRQAGLQPREQEPNKATYDGQLDSAVERVCSVVSELSRLPSAAAWERLQ